MTTYLTIEGRQVVNIGAPGSSAGDTTINRGSASMTDGGPAIGTFATRVVVVMPDANGRERRDTTVHVSMPPAAASVLKLTWNLMPNVGIDPEQATTIAFERLVNATSSGQATNDINMLSQGGSQGRLRMKGEEGTFTCGDAKLAQSRPGGIGLDSWLCRYDLRRGSVLLMTTGPAVQVVPPLCRRLAFGKHLARS